MILAQNFIEIRRAGHGLERKRVIMEGFFHGGAHRYALSQPFMLRYGYQPGFESQIFLKPVLICHARRKIRLERDDIKLNRPLGIF
jgi:hypothetical protein